MKILLAMLKHSLIHLTMMRMIKDRFRKLIRLMKDEK